MNILFPRSNWHISQANLPLPRALAFTVLGAAVLFCACRPDMSCGRMLFAVTEQQYQGAPFGMLFRPCSQLQASCPARFISKWCPRCRRKKQLIPNMRLVSEHQNPLVSQLFPLNEHDPGTYPISRHTCPTLILQSTSCGARRSRSQLLLDAPHFFAYKSVAKNMCFLAIFTY
jgi:hypothetical protein